MRPDIWIICPFAQNISIHASRMGCDLFAVKESNEGYVFQSTHPVWDATCNPSYYFAVFIFQSTHPVWDATASAAVLDAPVAFQSTHPVWDATIVTVSTVGVFQYFNPRIPYGMRLRQATGLDTMTVFQSTHPVWDATYIVLCPVCQNFYFNPRIPYGMRHVARRDAWFVIVISIHASRMGCDCENGHCIP